jgi:hypothetical protein
MLKAELLRGIYAEQPKVMCARGRVRREVAGLGEQRADHQVRARHDEAAEVLAAGRDGIDGGRGAHVGDAACAAEVLCAEHRCPAVDAQLRRIAPDGQRLALAVGPILVVLDRSGRKTTLSSGWGDMTTLAWSPSGDEVWFTASRDANITSAWTLRAVSLEGTNLTDTYEQLYNDTQAQRNEYYRNFGRQFFAGFRYSF